MKLFSFLLDNILRWYLGNFEVHCNHHHEGTQVAAHERNGDSIVVNLRMSSEIINIPSDITETGQHKVNIQFFIKSGLQ